MHKSGEFGEAASERVSDSHGVHVGASQFVVGQGWDVRCGLYSLFVLIELRFAAKMTQVGAPVAGALGAHENQYAEPVVEVVGVSPVLIPEAANRRTILNRPELARKPTPSFRQRDHP